MSEKIAIESVNISPVGGEKSTMGRISGTDMFWSWNEMVKVVMMKDEHGNDVDDKLSRAKEKRMRVIESQEVVRQNESENSFQRDNVVVSKRALCDFGGGTRVTTGKEERMLREGWTEIKLWKYVGLGICENLARERKNVAFYTFINFEPMQICEQEWRAIRRFRGD